MDYFKVVKKNSNLQIAITHVHIRVLLLVEDPVPLLVVGVVQIRVKVVQIRVKECVLVVHHVLAEIVVQDPASLDAGINALIPVRMDVRVHVTRNVETIVGVHAKRTALEVVKTDVKLIVVLTVLA